MQSLRAVAELLANARSLDDLGPIGSAIGCDGPPLPLDADTRSRLGLADLVLDVRVATGRGATRALLVAVRSDADLREQLSRIASQLASHAPHVLWLLIATRPAGDHVAIAAWDAGTRPPRVAALIVDRRRVVDSDAETLRALIAACNENDLLTHARWVEVLGREAMSARFFRALDISVRQIADSSAVGNGQDRDQLALLYMSRLLFVAFLEAKGWLDGDYGFLARQFDTCMTGGGAFHRRVLLPLFFGTLNTPARNRAAAARAFGRVPFLNGGLFTRTPAERRHRGLAFGDEAYGVLLRDVFAHFRFTAREESAGWNEAAVDPEMLGRAFESLMVARERRTSGAYFTPHALVERVTSAGLHYALVRAVGEQRAELIRLGAPLAIDDGAVVRTAVERLTVLDPACGSGAFLVHALEQLAALLRRAGDRRDVSTLRRHVLTRSIFGVDVNPMAVWLCELRLWLSVIIESDSGDTGTVEPLPNLDHNIHVGDALAGAAFHAAELPDGSGPALRALRARYARSTGARKERIARQMIAAERQRLLAACDRELGSIAAQRHELVLLRRSRDLFGDRRTLTRDERIAARGLRERAAALRATRRRVTDLSGVPFAWAAHFADVASAGGFDLIVGNPPWVRMHNVDPRARESYRRDYTAARNAGWEPGAGLAGAGAGFSGQVDVAALFLERSVRLLADEAPLSLLVPAKLWRSLAGGGIRRLLASETRVRRLDDLSSAPAAFDAAVYPSLIVATKRTTGDDSRACVETSLQRGEQTFRWRAGLDALSFDTSPGAPWVIAPRDVRRAFETLRGTGAPLASSPIGRPFLGVKCGCNDAFIVRVLEHDADLAMIEGADGRRATIESALLRPLARGEDITRWALRDLAMAIVWTHGDTSEPLATLPSHAARWFATWRRALTARTDASRASRWWSLFRTESARCDKPRVIWSDFGRVPRAAMIGAGRAIVPLNTCYVTRCADETDALAFTALLNSAVAAAWLNALAEPARGGFHRYLGWTMALLPVPPDWSRARRVLAPIAERARREPAQPIDHDLMEAVLDAYRLRHRDVAPLIAWLS